MPSTRWLRIAALLLLAIAFLPFVRGAFVWDDAALIEHNPALLTSRGYLDLVTHDLWGQATEHSSQLYHPVPMLSIWLQTLLFGMQIVPLRLGNIAIHACVVWLFVRLLERHALAPKLALGAGLLVLVHPSVCEPVMWITGRHDSLAMLAVLGALHCWPSHEATSAAWLRALGSGIGLALAFLSKEPYVIGPVLLALHAATLHAQTQRAATLRTLGMLSLAGLPLLGAIALRRLVGISLANAQLHAPWSDHARNYASIVWHYGTQLVGFRNGPTLQPFVPLGTAAALSVWALLIAVTAVLGQLAWRQRGAYTTALFGWLWFLVSLLPHVIATPTIGMYGNRYAYCGLFGLAACAASLASRVQVPNARMRSALSLGVLALACVCALRTGIQASHWRDNRTLYAADLADDPSNGFALYHLGTAVLTGEGCERALPLFVRATELAPGYERPWHNVTGCLIQLGHPERALPFAQRSVELAPRNARAHYNLALTLVAQREPARAVQQLQTALTIEPNYAAARTALAALSASTTPTR